MTDIALISDVAGNLPAPVKTSLLKAISNLLGDLTAIPTAWLRRPAQAINDTTLGRSTVATILAKGVAEEALKDSAIMQAAAEIYLPTIVRKARNRVQVAQRAADYATQSATDDTQAAVPDDDWMNSFMRFAEDASSDQLQDLFGRILAGQVVRPGSFALATLRAVAELDQSIAQDFDLVWAKSVGNSIDYDAEFRRGDWFSRWKRSTEAGLMAPTDTVQFLPTYQPIINDNGLWTPMSVGHTLLTVHFPQSCRAQWAHIDFTRIGCQIGSILAPPHYETNMRKAGQNLAQQGVARIELQSFGKPMDLIYTSATN